MGFTPGRQSPGASEWLHTGEVDRRVLHHGADIEGCLQGEGWQILTPSKKETGRSRRADSWEGHRKGRIGEQEEKSIQASERTRRRKEDAKRSEQKLKANSRDNRRCEERRERKKKRKRRREGRKGHDWPVGRLSLATEHHREEGTTNDHRNCQHLSLRKVR